MGMHQVPKRSSSGLLDEARASCAGPLVEIDAAAGAVVRANAAGWKVLGLEADTCAPWPLDCAMPAVQLLRRIAAVWDADIHTHALTFWTPRGHVTCRSEISRIVDMPATLCVRMLDTAAKLPTVPSAQTRSDAALNARLAHELRTPLGAVIAYAEILKDQHFGPTEWDRYRSYARNIHEGARHAMGVVDSMLKGAADEAAAQQLTFVDVDPATIVASCVAVARPLAEQAGLALSAEVPQHLPRVVADAVSVRQMLLNLLTNAVKFARRGDRVQVTVAYDGDGPLRISVIDTGPGMDETAQATGATKLPRPKARPAQTGLGLGLPLTRTLAEANGAVLAIDSALGRGTCATITFGKDRLVPV
jgi:signal transduction histidine kinase